MDKDKKDNFSVVSASLASIIRRSLNAPFRSECHLLLGVGTSTCAMDAIYCFLNGEKPKETVDLPTQLPQHQLSESSDVPKNFHSDEQNRNESEQNIRVTLSQEILGSCPASVNDSCISLSQTSCHTQKRPKLDTVTSADIPSDEEAQLDWDT